MAMFLKKSLQQPTNSSWLCRHFQSFTLCSSFSTLSSSSSAAASELAQAPVLPLFDFQPKPYNGPLADEVFQKRKKFLGPSLFHYYQKPVGFFFFSFLGSFIFLLKKTTECFVKNMNEIFFFKSVCFFWFCVCKYWVCFGILIALFVFMFGLIYINIYFF